ncbi:MAG TPA: hypothetical protein VGI40_05250 [Pirellulaceae bacterium]|jgi:hypothetical protein
MLLPSHRLIGIIRIEAPVLEIAGGEDDDSTIGGLLAGFAQRSLLADAACLSRVSPRFPPRRLTTRAATGSRIAADLERLMSDLEQEFAALSDVSA